MKSKKNKILTICSVALAAVIVASCLTACSENETEQVGSQVETESGSEKVVEPIKTSDLSTKIYFEDISYCINSNWEMFEDSGNRFYDLENDIKLKVIKQEMEEKEAVKALDDGENLYKHDYIINSRDKFLNCPSWSYSYSTDDKKSYCIGKQFYFSGNLYTINASAPESLRSDCIDVYKIFMQTINVESNDEKSAEKSTEKVTTVTDMYTQIFSSNEFDVYFVNAAPYKYDDNETIIKFMVNNKYNTQIEFQADTIILDGISYANIIMSDPVSANSLGYIEATVGDCNNSNPSAVGGDLRYFSGFEDDAVRGNINIPSTNVK